MRFALHAIHAGQGSRVSCACRLFHRKTRNSVRTDRRGGILFMRKGDFQAVRKSRESNFQMGMLCGKMPESLHASLDDRGLQPSDGLALESCAVAQKARYAARRRGQANVGIDPHVQIVRFSGHGC